MFAAQDNQDATVTETSPKVATKPRHAPKWNPPLRYAKDTFGATYIHSGPNRRQRRANDAFRRKVMVSKTVEMADGRTYQESYEGLGERSQHKKMLRRFSGRPIFSSGSKW